ncbi:MAG: glycosyltransferase [Ignavibacteria bacterium]|nr:glycosyltransferase [Ignavibacteria bacterium]
MSSLVSIVIGTKDRSDLLPRAINSALNQTYANIEIVIVDCSVGNDTELLLKSYHDDRIKLVRLPVDPGRTESLEIGLQNSLGEYICYLDDDDEFLPEKIAKQVAVFEQSGPDVGLVYTWAIYKHSKTLEVVNYYQPKNSAIC